MRLLPQRTLAEMAGAERGRPAVVLGGGPNLPEEFKRAPEGAVRISANRHGAMLTACDYLVTQEITDDTHGQLRAYRGLIVSPHALADIVTGNDRERVSGVEAARVAWVLGCAPILLAGMDLFQSYQEHWHPDGLMGTYGRDPPGPYLPRKLPKQLKEWKAMAARCPGAEFYALGGPLLGLFPAWEGA